MVDETDRLSRLVTNLLSVTRLESGKVRLNKAPDGLDDVVYGALQHLSGRLEGRSVEVSVPPDLPLVWMDSVLVDQVIVNLLENVLRYTQAGSPVAISLRATEEDLSVEMAIADPASPAKSSRRSSRSSTAAARPSRRTAARGSGSRFAGPSPARTAAASSSLGAPVAERWSNSHCRGPSRNESLKPTPSTR